ncbi:MAG TPA: cobalt ECF transporter T component CbiQ [Gemmataceae bacterium]|nr:cobalt ECF transporter T component CbiQ [Gemmataceae bacterium]
MTLGFDLPACPPSFTQRLDPRWKLAAILLTSILFVQLRNVGPAVAAVVATLLLIASARIPWRWCLNRLATSLLLFALFLGWLPFIVQDGDATLELGVITLSVTGTLRLVTLTAKIGAVLSLMLVLLATTPLPDIFKAARALWMPRLLVFLMLLTYRYVFLLVEEFARLRTALRVRGFRNRADLHSYRTVGQVAGTLLVRSHERSERVGQAMRCRGFDGEFRSLHEFRGGWPDVLAFLLTVSYAVALVVWDLSSR